VCVRPIFPVLRFFLPSGLAGLALAVIGIATSIFTGRGAAAITFGIGKLVGVSPGG
jgi:hypothetical protein